MNGKEISDNRLIDVSVKSVSKIVNMIPGTPIYKGTRRENFPLRNMFSIMNHSLKKIMILAMKSLLIVLIALKKIRFNGLMLLASTILKKFKILDGFLA